MYVVIWEFKVKPGCEEGFVKLCGSDGDWVDWFKKSSEYIVTDLLKSCDSEDVFITVDKWKSKDAYDQFYQSDQETFNRLDQRGEAYTSNERLIGAYTVA